MKILVLFQNTEPGNGGGIETYCHQLKSLFKNDTDVEVILSPLFPKKHPVYQRKYNEKELTELIQSVNPDIVHINGNTSLAVVQGIKCAKSLGKKVVLTPHWHPFEFMNRRLLSKLFFKTYIQPALPQVDAIITINKDEYIFFSTLHNNVKKFPHWIDHELITHKGAHVKDSNTILFVGRLAELNKGIEHLYSLPVGKYNIICVGKGDIPKREDITVIPHISDDDLGKLYAKSSLVVVPSRYEAFSYVALEALAQGTPVVMSERVRIADFLIPGNSHKIFQYHNYSDFKAKINEAINADFNVIEAIKPFQKKEARTNYRELYKSLT